MTSDTITITGIQFSRAAAVCVEETGVDPASDLWRLQDGATTRDALLAECLDGADADRVEGWIDYVAAVVSAAGVA